MVSGQTVLLYLKSHWEYYQNLLNHTKLSFIQLGGGMAVGVQMQQKKTIPLLMAPGMVIPFYTSVGVRTTLQVHSPLSQ